MANHFYAYISRMRCVKRWALMRNTEEENIQEHSHMVAVLAHALALIRNERFGGRVDAGAVAAAALYHDVCPRTRTPWRSPRSTTTQRRS